jgi:gamma-glutamyl hercynylcysteine S-oxide hydrolase
MLDQPNGLLTQSYAPRRQTHGRMNADGWGVGYYTDGRPQPARWRSNQPLWSATSFASVAPTLAAGCIIAAVRSATTGMPLDETASAPFQSGRWLLSHNGVVDRNLLGPNLSAESSCDSALFAAHLFDTGPDQLGDFVARVGSKDPGARLNMLLTDGNSIHATRWNDTLSVLVTEDGVAVASEPYDDDPRWVDVAEHHLLSVTAEAVTFTDLES